MRAADRLRVLFATAELAPLVTVGGLAQAAGGLVRELREQGVEVEVALPDYGGVKLERAKRLPLAVPPWARTATARRGKNALVGPLTLVKSPGVRRPHPYVDETGAGWPDNDMRFLGFSAAVAALARELQPDVVHLNDWHTATAAAELAGEVPLVLSIHNLAYQGLTGGEWLGRIGPHAAAFERNWGCNPLAGGIALADSVVVVSPTYREEVLLPESGAGLDWLLRARGEALLGIRNGIDADAWNPATDPELPEPFDADDLGGKARAREALLDRLGLADEPGPLAVAVTRLVEQKGVDLLLPLVPGLAQLGLRVAVLGAGDVWLVRALREAAEQHPESLVFVEGYDEPLSRLMLGGGDLLLMPSRFEPCGLAQMQAMRYGTLPVVTDVGGLHDTVVDHDEDPERGTGWRAAQASSESLWETLGRAVRGWSDPELRAAAQARAMSADWSWAEPAAQHVELYERLVAS